MFHRARRKHWKTNAILLRLSMSPSEGSQPAVLLVGEIFHANAEWEALSALGELRVRQELSLSRPAAARLLRRCFFGLQVRTDRHSRCSRSRTAIESNSSATADPDSTTGLWRSQGHMRASRCVTPKQPAATCTAPTSSIGEANDASLAS